MIRRQVAVFALAGHPHGGRASNATVAVADAPVAGLVTYGAAGVDAVGLRDDRPVVDDHRAVELRAVIQVTELGRGHDRTVVGRCNSHSDRRSSSR